MVKAYRDRFGLRTEKTVVFTFLATDILICWPFRQAARVSMGQWAGAVLLRV